VWIWMGFSVVFGRRWGYRWISLSFAGAGVDWMNFLGFSKCPGS